MKLRPVALLSTASTIAILTIAVLLSSCGGGGGGSTATGTVALYITDSMADYQQVLATINRIDLMHTGSGASCTVFTGPLTLDLADLAGVMQLIDVGPCSAIPYNRIHLEFEKSVALMDRAGSTAPCTFTSYKDDKNNPNILACGADRCTLDINGAVNVLANQQNTLALDFDLKDFDVVHFGDPAACSVTMKVSPLHAGQISARKHLKAVTGLVSALSATDRTFTLTKGHTAFSVVYSGITTSQQPGIDTLLLRAQSDRLRVRVLASEIDCLDHTITASALYVNVEGTIASDSLDTTNHTLTLHYRSGGSMMVNYGSAVVKGVLTEGGWIGVKLYGFDDPAFLAGKVEVEPVGTMTDD